MCTINDFNSLETVTILDLIYDMMLVKTLPPLRQDLILTTLDTWPKVCPTQLSSEVDGF